MKKKNAGRRRQERDTPFETRDLHRGGAHQRPRKGLQAFDGGPGRRVSGRGLLSADLLVQLEVAGLEHPDERARPELGAHRVDLRELAALAEDVEEDSGLRVGGPEHDPLIEDDRDRDAGEGEQQQQDELLDRAAAEDEVYGPPGQRGPLTEREHR